MLIMVLAGEFYSEIRTALTIPSWLGRFVILALPLSVWMIAPFNNLFCLARKVFWGVSTTVFISALWVLFVFGSRRLILFSERRIVFLFPPITLKVFLFVCLRLVLIP